MEKLLNMKKKIQLIEELLTLNFIFPCNRDFFCLHISWFQVAVE